MGSARFEELFCKDCGCKRIRRVELLRNISACPKCHCRTLKTDHRMLRHPTHYSEGRREDIEHCECCGYRYRTTRIVAKKVSSSYSSGSSGGGFSGGSSGGGGAGSSW